MAPTTGKKRKSTYLAENVPLSKQPRIMSTTAAPTTHTTTTPPTIATTPPRPPLQDISSTIFGSDNQQPTHQPSPERKQTSSPKFSFRNCIPAISNSSSLSSSTSSRTWSLTNGGQSDGQIPYCDPIDGSDNPTLQVASIRIPSTRHADRLNRVLFQQRHGDLGSRLLRRGLEGSSSCIPAAAFHLADWKMETRGFHSAPENVHHLQNSEARSSMPFCAAAFNNHPIVAVGDESGGVRLLATQPKLEGPVFKASKNFEHPLLGLVCHDNAIFDISIAPDDKVMATASGDQTARVFDLVRQTCIAELTEHMSSVKQIAFNPLNPSLLVTSSRDTNVHFWDLRVSGVSSTPKGDTKRYKPVNSILNAHIASRSRSSKSTAASVTAALWGARPEFEVMTACEANAIIKVWDIRLLRPLRRNLPKPVQESNLPPHHNFNPNRNYGITSINLSPSGDRVYALCKDSTVYAYSTSHLSSGPLHAYTHQSLRTTSFYVKCSLSKNGRLLATGSTDGSVILFPTDEEYLDDSIYGNAASSASYPWVSGNKSSFLKKELTVQNGMPLAHGHLKEVTGVSWAMDGSLVSISDDFTARLWRDGYAGEEAQGLRDGGENKDFDRWGWGWADD